MKSIIKLPSTHKRAAPFCAMLLLGHKVTSESWMQLTGRQRANQCAHDLRKLHLPLHAPRYEVSWSRNRVSVYQFIPDFIAELGEKRKTEYVEAVIKRNVRAPKLICRSFDLI